MDDKKSRYIATPLVKWTHPSGEIFELRALREIPVRPSVFAVMPILVPRR